MAYRDLASSYIASRDSLSRDRSHPQAYIRNPTLEELGGTSMVERREKEIDCGMRTIGSLCRVQLYLCGYASMYASVKDLAGTYGPWVHTDPVVAHALLLSTCQSKRGSDLVRSRFSVLPRIWRAREKWTSQCLLDRIDDQWQTVVRKCLTLIRQRANIRVPVSLTGMTWVEFLNLFLPCAVFLLN